MAVTPGPRVPLTEAAVAEGLKVLSTLPPPPAYSSRWKKWTTAVWKILSALPFLPADGKPITSEQQEEFPKQQEVTKKRHG